MDLYGTQFRSCLPTPGGITLNRTTECVEIYKHSFAGSLLISTEFQFPQKFVGTGTDIDCYTLSLKARAGWLFYMAVIRITESYQTLGQHSRHDYRRVNIFMRLQYRHITRSLAAF